MNFGYFDEENREYVITKPNTPAPWCNYLGSPEYGAIISNNAGGYSFVKSGADVSFVIISIVMIHRDVIFILEMMRTVIIGQHHGSLSEKTLTNIRVRFIMEQLTQRCLQNMPVSNQRLCIMYRSIRYMKYGV